MAPIALVFAFAFSPIAFGLSCAGAWAGPADAPELGSGLAPCEASAVRLLSSALFWRILLSSLLVVGVLGLGLVRAAPVARRARSRSSSASCSTT